jgi:hypothetical protein
MEVGMTDLAWIIQGESGQCSLLAMIAIAKSVGHARQLAVANSNYKKEVARMVEQEPDKVLPLDIPTVFSIFHECYE